jgi:tripartite-type tricarboxylate transporter receptor subunit TctC
VSAAKFALIAAAALSLIGTPGHAQEWPTRPPNVVVPFVAGGGVDVVARILIAEMAKPLGRQVVVENKPGASAAIGIRQIVEAQPDGYTVGMMTDVMTVTAAAGAASFDIQKDLAYIGQIVRVPLILVASGKAPFKTLPEMIAYAKANPGKVTAASIGPTSTHHLGMEWLKAETGIDMLVVPYRGVANGLTALAANEVQLMFMGAGVADEYVASGILRYLAVGSTKRMAKLPNVPTVAESGVKDFELVSWYGLVAPAKTPQAVIARWSDAVRQALDNPSVRQRVENTGCEVMVTSGPDFARHVQRETEKYAALMRRVGPAK